jgi:hypothetical protein
LTFGAFERRQLTYQKLKKSWTSFSLVCELMPLTWTVFDILEVMLGCIGSVVSDCSIGKKLEKWNGVLYVWKEAAFARHFVACKTRASLTSFALALAATLHHPCGAAENLKHKHGFAFFAV